jgi:hypothetical protein
VIVSWFPVSATALAADANHACSGRVLCKPFLALLRRSHLIPVIIDHLPERHYLANFRVDDDRGNTPIFEGMASMREAGVRNALGAYPNCISGGTSGVMSDAPPSA